jgi:hypothetical protein
MSIFGTAFDASTGRWIAFNEETLTSLSEHDTKADALDACRRYFEREMRRANILQYLTRKPSAFRSWNVTYPIQSAEDRSPYLSFR